MGPTTRSSSTSGVITIRRSTLLGVLAVVGALGLGLTGGIAIAGNGAAETGTERSTQRSDGRNAVASTTTTAPAAPAPGTGVPESGDADGDRSDAGGAQGDAAPIAPPAEQAHAAPAAEPAPSVVDFCAAPDAPVTCFPDIHHPREWVPIQFGP